MHTNTRLDAIHVPSTSLYSGKASSATTVLSSVTLHTYCGQLVWQNIVFMNIYEAGETNLLPMKSNVTIKYSMSY